MKTLFFLFLMIFVSCKAADPKLPEDVLTQEQMVSLLIDFYLIEGKVRVLKQPQDSAVSVFNVFEEELYQKHQTDSIQHLHSYNYYLQHPKELNEIYVAVVDSLNLREKVVKKNKESSTEP